MAGILQSEIHGDEAQPAASRRRFQIDSNDLKIRQQREKPRSQIPRNPRDYQGWLCITHQSGLLEDCCFGGGMGIPGLIGIGGAAPKYFSSNVGVAES